MKQLLSADLYKFRKSKSPYVCTIVCLALAVLNVVSLNLLSKMTVVSEGIEGAYSQLSFTSVVRQGYSSNGLIFMGIIIAIFIGSEFAHGTIKNTASKSFSRVKLFMSKWIISVTAGIVLMLLYVVFFGVLALIFFGYGTPEPGFLTDLLIVTGVRILLETAVCSLFVTITILIRQSGGAIAVNICILNFTMLVVQIIQTVIHYFFKVEWGLSTYLPSSIISELVPGPITGNLVTRGVVISILLIALSLIVGIFSFRKSDIK